VTLDVTTGELVPATRPDLLSAAPVSDVVALQRAYLDLSGALLDANDYQAIGGTRYKKKSAWRKLAAAFNVSDTILEKVYYRDEDGRIGRAEVTVRATAPNGRSAEGLGVCSTREPRGFANPEHDIPATAHTRAKNRAFSDLFGLGEVSAEEMATTTVTASSSGRKPRRPKAAPPAAAPTPTDDTGELEARLMKLSLDGRAAFKAWRYSRGLGWPPATPEALRLMLAEVAVIEEREDEEHQGYEPPVGSPID
jgi:hypothetical protein